VNLDSGRSGDGIIHGGQILGFKRDQHRLFAHHGYVYCMLLVRGLIESSAEEEVLLTGSGDGSVKQWKLGQGSGGAPATLAELCNDGDSVLSLAVDGSFLYCGLSGGAVNIWNLDTQQMIRRLTSHDGDIWAIDIVNRIMISGDSGGVVKVYLSVSLYLFIFAPCDNF
jgi:di- and tripeptidase